jgi:hypothetical protein
MVPVEFGDPAGTWHRLALDFRHRNVLRMIASGPVFDSSAPDELRQRVAQWIETTAAGEPN